MDDTFVTINWDDGESRIVWADNNDRAAVRGFTASTTPSDWNYYSTDIYWGVSTSGYARYHSIYLGM